LAIFSKSSKQSKIIAIFKSDGNEISPVFSNRLIDPKLTPDLSDSAFWENPIANLRCLNLFFNSCITNWGVLCIKVKILNLYRMTLYPLGHHSLQKMYFFSKN